ncbi:hypothetical protein [Solirubrum puertoriconensis]|uniref:DUF998 domain-containing protein n=1 Tax=Solirubrum puertoriconensis TaxID=1751427 RepID=A0A9X0HN43_SOLP1|nr:hypothetical protein [Solirubrum puertoriconensis]KUG09047.1 hypothetical protein ASU33_19680 [Solirubrum puertoriconensis]
MERPFIISYFALRRTVGWLGIAFPLVLILGSVTLSNCEWPDIQSSISGYYHTVMRDVFVGTLCIVAFFLFAYRAYSPWDAVAGRAASVFALGVAFFPTTLEPPYTVCTRLPLAPAPWVGTVHYICAALLFTIFTLFSLVLFTRTDHYVTPSKRIRNGVYRGCGTVMAACIALLTAYFLLDEPAALRPYKPVFWLEGIALISFGISWLTKGEFLFPDSEQEAAAKRSAIASAAKQLPQAS